MHICSLQKRFRGVNILGVAPTSTWHVALSLLQFVFCRIRLWAVVRPQILLCAPQIMAVTQRHRFELTSCLSYKANFHPMIPPILITFTGEKHICKATKQNFLLFFRFRYSYTWINYSHITIFSNKLRRW